MTTLPAWVRHRGTDRPAGWRATLLILFSFGCDGSLALAQNSPALSRFGTTHRFFFNFFFSAPSDLPNAPNDTGTVRPGAPVQRQPIHPIGRTCKVPRQDGQRANQTVGARERARSAYKDVRTTSMCMICRGQRASSMLVFPHPCPRLEKFGLLP